MEKKKRSLRPACVSAERLEHCLQKYSLAREEAMMERRQDAYAQIDSLKMIRGGKYWPSLRKFLLFCEGKSASLRARSERRFDFYAARTF